VSDSRTSPLAAESFPPESTDADETISPVGGRIVRRLAAAFLYRDFRVLWFGACTSSIGTWMQSLAENWLVLSLTGSALFLGLDAFLQQLPIMLFTLVGGVLADRRDRRKTLLGSQYVQMTSAFVLALLVYFHLIQVWHILALSFLTGCAQSFGGPAYQALIPSLVGPKDLTNAIALNSIQFNVARVIGPLLAGATLAAFARAGASEQTAMSACFGLNSLSFLVVIVALLSLHVKHIPVTHSRPILDDLRGGLSYVRGERAIFVLVVLAAATAFFGFPVLTLLPLFAKNVFGGDVGRYSTLMAFSGAGAIAGALLVAWLGRFKHMGLTILLVQMTFGALMVALAISRTLWLTDLLLFLSGAGLMIAFSAVTSLVQILAPDEFRGRVMSIYMVAFRGGMPLGSLASGYFASVTSAPIAMGVNGALVSLVGVYFLLRSRSMRRL
jgi:MFS family permease